MIIKINTTCEFIKRFVTKYHDLIDSIKSEESWMIGATSDNTKFRYSTYTDSDPFGLNNLFHCIAVNLDKCNEYKLTEDEMTAMLLHEFGHIVYPVIQQEGESDNAFSLRKELEADRLVIEQGMRVHLCSGLTKLQSIPFFRDRGIEDRLKSLNGV